METPERSISFEQKRRDIVDAFHNKLHVLGSSLAQNNEINRTVRPRGLIIMSLWEEDETMLTAKMAKESLSSLVDQADKSGIDLDIVLIANNGGGKTNILGEKLRSNMKDLIQSQTNKHSLIEVETRQPEGVLKTTEPWSLDIPLVDSDFTDMEGRNRWIIVNQPISELNKGKLRGLRDVTKAISQEVTRGYKPDFIMEMDAESTLMFSSQVLAGKEQEFPPLKVMWNHLNRNQLIGVGTKDRFAIMNEDTGKPEVTRPVGSAQKGYELTNTPNNFITLPGGAMMVKPEYYLAGMSTIAEHTPSMGVHDYLFTKLLREETKQKGLKFEEEAETLGIINHINRTPDDWRAAINQMKSWKLHAQAADKIFPDNPYQPEPFIKYAWLVITTRFKDAATKGPVHLKQLLHDLMEIPETLKFLLDNTAADIFKDGSIEWTPKSITS